MTEPLTPQALEEVIEKVKEWKETLEMAGEFSKFDPPIEAGEIKMLIDYIDQLKEKNERLGKVLDDATSMRHYGNELAIAAQYVVKEYDGTHRLALAISEWNKVIANEGGRGSPTPDDMVQVLDEIQFCCGKAEHNGKIESLIGGCGKDVSAWESYRCSDCAATFHRDCLINHLKDETEKDGRVFFLTKERNEAREYAVELKRENNKLKEENILLRNKLSKYE